MEHNNDMLNMNSMQNFFVDIREVAHGALVADGNSVELELVPCGW
jgi:hypothetical protein